MGSKRIKDVNSTKSFLKRTNKGEKYLSCLKMLKERVVKICSEEKNVSNQRCGHY